MKATASTQRINPSLLFLGVGKRTISLVNNLGAMAIFFSLAFINIFRRRQLREIVNQVTVKNWVAGFMLLLMLMLPVQASAGVPLDTVKTKVNGVLDMLRDPKLQGEAGRKVKEQRLEAAAENLFDFVELSKRTIGLNWNKFTPEQRKEFVELFKTILKDTYLERIIAYSNEQVDFTKEISLSENTVEVQSVVMAKSGGVPVCYRVIKKENDWKVFDVVIEGVSLISNYRTQFREILGNNPPEKLLESLRKKVGKK